MLPPRLQIYDSYLILILEVCSLMVPPLFSSFFRVTFRTMINFNWACSIVPGAAIQAELSPVTDFREACCRYAPTIDTALLNMRHE